MIKNRRNNSKGDSIIKWVGKNLIIFIIVCLFIIGILYVIQDSIKAFLFTTSFWAAGFHAYMIGLLIPESLYFKIFWNPSLKRPVRVKNRKMFPIYIFILFAIIIAIFGFIGIHMFFIPTLINLFMTLSYSEFPIWFLYGLWFIFSHLILPYVFVILASPTNFKQVNNSIRRNISSN